MRNPCPIQLTFSICALSLALSGCGGTKTSSSSATDPPPTVAAVAAQTDGVAPNREQEVQFSEAMDPATINAQSFQVADSSGKQVTGSVTYDPDFNTASFLPSPALQPGATYTATISTTAASAGGAHLAKPYTFDFTTRATTDTSPLSVTSVSPTANATCVSTTTPITVTFNEGPDASSLTPGNFMVTGPNGAITVKIGTNITTTQVVLTPSSPLASGAISVTVSNVTDLAGVKMTAPYTWSFSTACSGGGGGTGSGTTTQYQAPLSGKTGAGQITVDTAGNVTVQLKGAAASQTFTVQFCPIFPDTQSSPNCFFIGSLTTDANGNGGLAEKFPKSGAWAGDFQLVNGPVDQTGYSAAYSTGYLPSYSSTLEPETSIVSLANQGSSQSQEPFAGGTVTYSSSPAPNGAFQFSLTAAPANTSFSFDEGGLALGGSGNYQIYDSQGNSQFTTDSQGDLTATLLPSQHGGDIFYVYSSQQSYYGGFSIP